MHNIRVDMSLDQATLLNRFKEGDRTAYKILYEKYWPKVYKFASLYLKNRTDLQDMVQDVFIKIWENREKINSDIGFDGYLFIITRNHVFNQARSKVDKNFIDLTYLNLIDKLQNTEDEVVANNLQEFINELVEAMNPPQRKQIFNLSRKEYKSYKEISMQLNLSERTIEYHLSQALAFLRVRLKDYLGFLLLFLYR